MGKFQKISRAEMKNVTGGKLASYVASCLDSNDRVLGKIYNLPPSCPGAAGSCYKLFPTTATSYTCSTM